MLKRIGLLVLFILPLLFGLGFGQRLTSYERMPQSVILKVRNPLVVLADTILTEGAVMINGQLSYEKACFGLSVVTRGTNDTLFVIIQTCPDPGDTLAYPWKNLTNFNAGKFALGNTYQCYPTLLAVQDTIGTGIPFRYFRAVSTHSIDICTAADTSTWFLFINQYGNKLR